MGKAVTTIPVATDAVLGAHPWQADAFAPKFQRCPRCGAQGMWNRGWKKFYTTAGETCREASDE